MVKKFNRKELNSIVKNYIDSLKGKIEIQQALLFGSYAKGSADENSDIDLLIISKELSKDKLKTSNGYFLDSLVGDVDPCLEVIGIHPDNLDDEFSESFYKEIFKTGKSLELH